jgi:hypothetical protein
MFFSEKLVHCVYEYNYQSLIWNIHSHLNEALTRNFSGPFLSSKGTSTPKEDPILVLKFSETPSVFIWNYIFGAANADGKEIDAAVSVDNNLLQMDYYLFRIVRAE